MFYVLSNVVQQIEHARFIETGPYEDQLDAAGLIEHAFGCLKIVDEHQLMPVQDMPDTLLSIGRDRAQDSSHGASASNPYTAGQRTVVPRARAR